MRIKTISQKQNNGNCIVYVMSRDQRVADNHALLAAQEAALLRKCPLIVLFVLYYHSGFRSREHYQWMLRGIALVEQDLHAHNIPLIMRTGDPLHAIPAFLREVQAAAVYFDFSPLIGPRKLAHAVSNVFDGSCHVVDTHNIVPAWVVSNKQEFAAHTFRRKIHAQLEQYSALPPEICKHPYAIRQMPQTATESQIDAIVQQLPYCGVAIDATPGEQAAYKHAEDFIQNDLATYALLRNDPNKNAQSNLSPYLHFGQISSLRVAHMMMDAVKERPLLFTEARMATADGYPSRADGMNALFEEMIVRKELSDNFCLYAASYTTLQSVPGWARRTLRAHATDQRDFTYNRAEWEQAQTHDDAWNAAQNQMTQTGKMHGYMRMYWAKKLLEWSASPEEAVETAIYLNDKYSIDGGDPNGYVGILWSIAGLHDRPWRERSVFGQIRYMNNTGLRRKFDLDAYIQRWI